MESKEKTSKFNKCDYCGLKVIDVKKILSLLLIVWIIAGCAGGVVSSLNSVSSLVSVFHNIDEQHKIKKVVVLPFQKELESSLEFQSYRNMIENRLREYGFQIVKEMNSSDFTVFVSYGIDTGQEKIVSAPIYGSTGGGITDSSGTVSTLSGDTAFYSGTSYSMPTYGVVGSETASFTIYTRKLAIDMVETTTLRSEKLSKIYEGRVVSKGSCGIISAVMPEMLVSLLGEFPGISGTVKKIDIAYEGSKCGE